MSGFDSFCLYFGKFIILAIGGTAIACMLGAIAGWLHGPDEQEQPKKPT